MEHYKTTRLDYDRRNSSFDIRLRAAENSREGPYSGDNGHVTNGDEKRFPETLLASFTKGLAHNRSTGLIKNTADFDAFVSAVNSGDVEEISRLPLGPSGGDTFSSSMAKGVEVRAWESMAAGLAFELEGPDAQRPTMPPAPQIDSLELAFEMSELYWMALLRDVRFRDLTDNSENGKIVAAARALASHSWVKNPESDGKLTEEQKRRIPECVTTGTLFRGTSPGDRVGPYLSQFLLVGTEGLGGSGDEKDGLISYGSMRMDQRVRIAVENRDYMTTWQAFIDVQNAADVRGFEKYTDDNNYRFITSPRDLATYVHYDALYQAYLNACLILLEMKVPFDDGLPFGGPDKIDKQSGFALFGPPHILTLVTEVATRALKSVRFQKYNKHRRPRPEAVAALIDVYTRQNNNRQAFSDVSSLSERVDSEAMERIAAHNADQNKTQNDKNGPRSADYDPVNTDSEDLPTYLLPMAFAEGSPMHPSYGAGHAAVAGACVTILKAFFKSETELKNAYVPSADGKKLESITLGHKLTVEGELNKICSNISIGRDWAGVHWTSDYRESIVMGQEIAIGLLKEQKLTYGETFSMTVPLFDGTTKTI